MKVLEAIFGLYLTLIHHKIFDNKILVGKRVAVVGPASSAFEAENGKFIDSFDYVIRINKAIVQWDKENERFIGTKTDILVHSMYENNVSGGGKLDFSLFKKHGVKYILNPKNNFEGWRLTFNYYKKYLEENTLYLLPKKKSDSCFALFPQELRPTMGFFALYLALTSQCSEVFITGFTFFKTPYAKGYRDNLRDMDANKKHIQNQGIHNPDIELDQFLNLLNSTSAENVHFDKVLNSIVEGTKVG